MPTAPLDPKAVIKQDPWLENEVPAIVHRHDLFRKWKDTIVEHEKGYDAFSRGYERFGLHMRGDGSVSYTEWAPNAKEAYLVGDFSESCSALHW